MRSNSRILPYNFDEIEPYVISGFDLAKDLFFDFENKIFYDTCSIIHHSNSHNNHRIVEYILESNSVVIITRTVVMELASEDNKIHAIQIKYLRKLYDVGVKIILLDEEDSVDLLKEALNISNVESNLLLGYAVKEVMKLKTTVSNIVRKLDESQKSRILGNDPGNELLYKLFFEFSRGQKISNDSLAEELIFICMIVLTRMPFGRYIFLSDDLASRSSVISVSEYIKKHHDTYAPIQITTPSLLNRMCTKNMIESEVEMKELLSCVSSGKIRVYFAGEYDIEMKYESFDIDELVERIMNEDGFRVFY